MSFFDNLIDNVQDAAESSFSNFVSESVSSGLNQNRFISIGTPLKGNQTSKQISAGQRGAQPSQTISARPSSDNSGLKNGFGFSLGENGMSAMIPVAVLAAFIGAALLLRRK